MPRTLFAALALVALPGPALAEPGGRGDLDQVRREVEAMQRDGRWERLLAEGQANRQAFGEQRQAAPPVQPPRAAGPVRARSRQ